MEPGRYMVALSAETKSQFVFCDAHLVGLSWYEDGRDFAIKLCLSDGRDAELLCTWAHGVRIDLRYEDDQSGHVLSWESYVEAEGQDWRLVLDFRSEGRIELMCNTAHLEIAASA